LQTRLVPSTVLLGFVYVYNFLPTTDLVPTHLNRTEKCATLLVC